MKLRDYQLKAKRRAVELLRAGKRVLVVGPTGSGKTVVGTAINGRTLVRKDGYQQVWRCAAGHEAQAPASQIAKTRCKRCGIQRNPTRPLAPNEAVSA